MEPMSIEIKTDASRIDRERLHRWLTAEAYWSLGIPRAVVDKAIDNSLCFCAIRDGAMVGFARVVTDRATLPVEAKRGDIPQMLRDLKGEGAVIATVCTGAMIAARAGLTKGRPATTHHSALDELRASGADVVDARVVDDGDLIMAGGVTSGIDLALWIVEREFGKGIADSVTEEIEFPRNHQVWRRQPVA